MPFTTEELDLLESAEEVLIETRSERGSHRTIIWIGVDETDVFVRSVRGVSGRWYQRLLDDPRAGVIVAGVNIPVSATRADAASIERASEAFKSKYPPSRSLDSMLRPDVLSTTLVLVRVGQ